MANWDYISECAKQAHPEIAIFGSGDVLSFEDYERSVKDYGVDGVLLARLSHWNFGSTSLHEFKASEVNHRNDTKKIKLTSY